MKKIKVLQKKWKTENFNKHTLTLKTIINHIYVNIVVQLGNSGGTVSRAKFNIGYNNF